MKYSAIVLAAGSGKRTGLGYNKMFFKLGDECVIEKTLKPFIKDEDCKQVIVVVNEKEIGDFKVLPIIRNAKIELVTGGLERQNSVCNGLECVKEEFVMIHDGARCFFDERLLNRLKLELTDEQAGLLMVDSVDTVKVVEDGYVKETLVRSKLKCAQTPQCFNTELIKEVHQKAQLTPINFSDDASMVEQLSDVKVKVVEGAYYNKKLTTQEDIKNLYKKEKDC